jgi:ABC-type nitrate/sulfonate/bicarbonate transport system substrate-binding protein
MGSQPFIHIAEKKKKKEKLDDETIKEVLATYIESGKYSEQNNEEYNEVLQRQ